jgi:hypothetical protein
MLKAEGQMPTSRRQGLRQFRLDPRKLQRAKRLLGASTEDEALDRALDQVIIEHERNRWALEANERFLASGIQIRDVFDR